MPAEAPAAVPASKPVKSVVPEPDKASNVEMEPAQLDLEDDEEEMAEDLDDVSEEEMEEEIEEELGLGNEDDDVDYLEKSEDLLDDADEYRNN